MSAKYVIGIDLGTTNCVLSYTLLSEEEPEVHLLKVPQYTAAGEIDSQFTLPSFVYLTAPHEAGSFGLPWSDDQGYVTGQLARERSAEFPDRTVGAAKSWLCYSKIDRHQPVLPWKAPDEVNQISPVTASQYYLEHLAAAWNAAFPDDPLASQQIVLTVPASFDVSARELTREAALGAGLPESLILLEEPQAAVYAWLSSMGDRWRKALSVSDRLLVCDVGGGTTDLSLVGVTEDNGELALERAAVGNHLLVGGDNMDLALAHHVAGLFDKKGVKLNPWQSVSLWHSCRAAKEALLTPGGAEKHKISVLGRGSKVIGGTVSVEVDRDAVTKLLMDGFLPGCSIDDKPVRQRASGFQQIGLPYESDTAITRHLAAFLQANGGVDEAARPTHVLFNGGVFRSELMRDELLKTISGWFPDGGAAEMLQGEHDLDHAVARGAAYYGHVKTHGGVRIRGGAPRSYYVGIETAGLAVPGAPRPLQALCVVPMGMEEGTEVDVDSEEIGVVLGEAAQFRFFSSAIRKDDKPGEMLPHIDEEELQETDSLEATLPAAADVDEPYVPVKFRSKITELGVFELWCVGARTPGEWKLEFSVRDEPA